MKCTALFSAFALVAGCSSTTESLSDAAESAVTDGSDAVSQTDAIDHTSTDGTAPDAPPDTGASRDVIITDVPTDGPHDAGVTHPSMPIRVAIDASRTVRAIPADFIGMSFTRNAIGGNPPFRAIFSDASTRPGLLSVMRQIGVRHIRILSEQASDPDPMSVHNHAFFSFAQELGLGDHSVTYSLNIYQVAEGPGQSFVPSTYAGNTQTVMDLWTSYANMIDSFAFGNEPDWSIGGNWSRYTTYRSNWNALYDQVQSAMGHPSPAIPFSGPDTGCEAPAPNTLDTQVRVPMGSPVPFSQQFANDERGRLAFISQHYYGGASDRAPAWAVGETYGVGDAVTDPADNHTYQCTHFIATSHAGENPRNNMSFWVAFPAIWAAGSYPAGQYVQYSDGNDYLCNVAAPATACTTAPDPSNPDGPPWKRDGAPLLSARQMARGMLDPTWPQHYDQLLNGALTGSTGWPSPMRFRLTESNAYAGGHDPGERIFALALWAVDYFHWWAARGALGVDPFTILSQYNAPIYSDAGTITAAPYAYGMLAFGQGGHGAPVDPNAVMRSPFHDWITAYAVVAAGHLYVTLVNKTYDTGSIDAPVTIAPSAFTARHARMMTLESTPGATGDATAPSAILGGAPIDAAVPWSGTWTPVPVNADGTVASIVVRATTAVVVDITNL